MEQGDRKDDLEHDHQKKQAMDNLRHLQSKLQAADITREEFVRKMTTDWATNAKIDSRSIGIKVREVPQECSCFRSFWICGTTDQLGEFREVSALIASKRAVVPTFMRAAASRTVRPFLISILACFSFSAVTIALRPLFRTTGREQCTHV